MTRFIHLKIRNANPFKSVDLNFEKKGLVRLVGRNGAGKSSLWHLMTFLYYGVNPTGATKSVIQMDVKDFLIEGSFEKEGIRYWCCTAQKSKEKSPMGEPYGSGYFLYKRNPEGAWENISWHKAADTQKLVKDLLGWSLEEWYGYVYLAQQTSHTLIMGTPAERQRYLSALFNLEPLDVIADHYKVRATAEEGKVRELQKKQDEITVLENMMTVARFHNVFPEDLEKQIDDFKFKIEDTNFLIGELTEEQKRYDELGRLHVLMDLCMTDFILIDDGAEQEKKVLSEIEALQTESAEFRAVTSQCNMLALKSGAVDQRIKRLAVGSEPEDYQVILASPDISLASEQARLDQLREIEKKIKRTLTQPEPIPTDHEIIMAYQEIDLARTEREIATIKQRPKPPECTRPEEEDLDMLRADLSTARANQTFLHDRRAQLMMEGKCPTCGTDLDAQHRIQEQANVDQELDRIEGDLKTIPALLNKLTKERDAWIAYDKLGPDRSAEIPELERAVSQYRMKLTYRVLLNTNNVWLENELNIERAKQIPAIEESIRIYTKKVEYRKFAEQAKELEMLRVQHTEMLVELKDINLKLAGLRDRTAEVQTLRGQLENLKKLISIKQQLDVLRASKPNDVSAEMEIHRLTVQDLQTRMGETRAQLEELQDLIRRIQALTGEISGADQVVREQKKCEILAKEYGNAGKIRKMQLSRFTGYLRDALTCHTYQQLSEHAITFDVKSGIVINTSKNGCIPYDVSQMSGGEKGALSGAFLFALDDMLPADRRTSLKIVDELEANFDKERKQGFLEHMLPELRNRAETVVVISHTEIDDQSLFDRTWKIENGKVLDVSGEIREHV